MFEWLGEKLGVNREVFALSSARLADAVGNSILFIVLPLYVNRVPSPVVSFGEAMRVGILIAIYGLVSAIFEPFLGSLVDRIGHRKLLVVIGLLVSFAGMVSFAFVNQYLWLLVLRAVQGLGLAITVPAEMALMAAITRQESRGRAMGFLTMMRMLGFALGPLIGGALIDHVGFASTFYTGGGLGVLAAVLVQWWVREPEQSKHGEKEPEKAPGFFDRRLWNAGVVGAGIATLSMALGFTVMTTLEKQFNHRLNQSAFWFGVAFSAMTVTRLIFQIPFGWVSDRWGRKPIIIIGLVVMAPATTFQGYVGTTWELIALRAVQGLTSAAVAAPALALAADWSRAGGVGRQMSLAIIGFSLGLAIGPLLAGFLAPIFFSLPFIVAGGIVLAGAYLVWQFAPSAKPPRARG